MIKIIKSLLKKLHKTKGEQCEREIPLDCFKCEYFKEEELFDRWEKKKALQQTCTLCGKKPTEEFNQSEFCAKKAVQNIKRKAEEIHTYLDYYPTQIITQEFYDSKMFTTYRDEKGRLHREVIK
jgi:hypothetical protein